MIVYTLRFWMPDNTLSIPIFFCSLDCVNKAVSEVLVCESDDSVVCEEETDPRFAYHCEWCNKEISKQLKQSRDDNDDTSTESGEGTGHET